MSGKHLRLRFSARWRVWAVGIAALPLTVSLAPPPPVHVLSAPNPPATSSHPRPEAPQPKSASARPASASATDSAVYAYDAAGRLVGITDPKGETARYRYDAAGNRLGIDRYPSARLSVLSLVPVRAAAGAKVTLSGTGFATTTAGNAVSFGGRTAQVLSASPTRLVVTVPEGAPGGRISVASGGTSAESPESFTLASGGPKITGMNPAVGPPGIQVTLGGAQFATAVTDNVVRFNGLVAEVVSRSESSLTVKVPDGATTGPVEVETPDGRRTAPGDFTVPLSDQAGSIETTVRTSVTDTSPRSVAVTQPGKRAVVLFDADRGRSVSARFTESTFKDVVRFKLISPQGFQVGDEEGWAAWAGPDTWRSAELPLSGTYMLIVDPGKDNIGAAKVLLSQAIERELSFTGEAGVAEITRAGQSTRWTFSAQAGESLSLGIDASRMPDYVHGDLYGPDGKKLDFFGIPNSVDGVTSIDKLPQSGRYLFIVDPTSEGTGTVRVIVSHYLNFGTLDDSAPGTDLAINRIGQRAVGTFRAARGDRVSLGFPGFTFDPFINMKIFAPSGAETVSKAVSQTWDSEALPEDGTYTVRFDPLSGKPGRTGIVLSRPLALPRLTADGSPVSVAIGRFGQRAESSFTAQSGQSLALGFVKNAFTKLLEVSVVAPSGAKMLDKASVSAGQDASLPIPKLSESGTYQVTMDVWQGGTGSVDLFLAQAGSALARSLASSMHTPCYSVIWHMACPPSTGTERAHQPARPSAAAPAPVHRATPSPPPAQHKPDVRPASAEVGIVPSGPDAWQPDPSHLAGRDWTTRRGSGPKAPTGVRALPGTTAVTGHVLKLDGTPLAKVRVSVGRASALTDDRGRFLLPGIDTGATTLLVEGGTADAGDRHYGVFRIRIRPKAGETTDLGFPVWMTPLDTRHTLTFEAPAQQDIVLTTPQIPGLEVRIPKGSVVRDERGNPVTRLGITAIPIDRPPFPLPKNRVVPVFFTVQPGGTYVFPKGAQIVYPNYTHEPPGTVVEFMDYDPKGRGWYVYGHGAVTADGRQVVPDAKTRIWAFNGAMFNVSDLIPWDLSRISDVIDWLSGDPVDLGTGMLTDSRTDLAVADPLGSAEVNRTYWQGDTQTRAFGIGRDLSYNVFLHSQEQYKEVDLYLPGGQRVHYVRTSPGSSYSDAVFEPAGTPGGFRGTKIAWNNNAGWDLTFRDGSVWVFPQYAPLKEIRDRHGNTVRLTRLNDTKGQVTRITTPDGRWITLSYDGQHRVSTARDNTGRTTTYSYDSAGRLQTVTDPAGKTSRYTYDGTSNRIASAQDARGIVYMTNSYDADGRLKKQTLAEGATYSFDYAKNPAGKITATDVKQPSGAVRRVTFDSDGFGTSDTAAYGSPLARKTVFERGPNHRVDAVVDPFGRRTELHYDAAGHVTSSTELAGTPKARESGKVAYEGPYDQISQATDRLGNTTMFRYDTGNDLQTVVDPEGRTTTLTHTSEGLVRSVTDAAGAVTEYTYRHGERVTVKDAEGRVSAQFTDAAGRPTALSDTAGAVSTITYDRLNQTTGTSDRLGNTVRFSYDDNGNLTSLSDARGKISTWAYDQADRPTSATDPAGVAATFTYDAADRLTRSISRSGQVATAEYDLLGRTTKTMYGVDTGGKAESTASYTYDRVDLLQQITDSASGNQSFTYDEYDRTTAVTGPTGTVSYGYDAAGRRTQMNATGVTTGYSYDKSGALTSLTSGKDTITFALDKAGREKTASLPGGWSRTTDLDATGLVKAITYSRSGAAVGDLTYARDERGLQTGLTGKLVKVALPAAESGAAFDDTNRLTQLAGRSFTYDKDGRLTSDGERGYSWNARGQLTGLTRGGNTATFGYDPLGGRTSKQAGGTSTRFLTDGTNPLAELDSSGKPTATVAASGLDRFLTRTTSGKTQIYLTDALGSVVGLADDDGTIATTYTYDPNGRPIPDGAPTSNPYTFTGREDDGTGLLYLRNRYYDPATGRFISQDPIGHAAGPNLYQYALSSPTTYTDPSGNNPMIAGCVAGGLMDGGIDWLGQRLSGRKVNWGQVITSAASGCAMGMLGNGLGEFLDGWGASRAARCLTNSFTPETPVLMADGTQKPIKDVKIGDQVVATDPETGETAPRKVTTLIQGDGQKQLVDLTTKSSTGTGHLTATDGHPFWVPALHIWTPAAQLKPGQWLQTSTGTWVQVTAVQHRTTAAVVHNLTVDGLHTYYVLAGETPVLVHNSNCDLPEGYTSSPALKGDPYHPDSVAERSRQNRELYAGTVADRAGALGYRTRIPTQKAPFNSHGQVVFSNGKNYITPDVDGHNVTDGWKMFNRRGQRIGTYDPDLNYLKE
ncbi:RHS repeat-associated core domain-containing protein [Streptomyces sp. NPDC001678]|uniref:RHS repeat-associated core domain-containing protein n=1 Tax=Streptomyces sp. NPDC001678 TaxID=3364599 RepID=UPI0036BA20EF